MGPIPVVGFPTRDRGDDTDRYYRGIFNRRGILVDNADFANGGDAGFGGFDHDLGKIAAFGHLLAGFVGPVPIEGVGPCAAAVHTGPEVAMTDLLTWQVLEL